MRFFIGCTEICGMINTYADELKKQGHEVTTCVNSKHRFYPDQEYDIQSNYWADYLFGRNSNHEYNTPPGFLNKAALKLRTTTSLFDGLISKKIFDKHDVFIFLWAGDYLMRNGKDLRVLKEKGKKIISILVGSDVRYPQAFQQEFGNDTSQWPAQYRKPFSYYNRVMREVEMYSDVIYSTPDQSGLALRPYEHFPIPMNLSRYRFNWTDRDEPVIVHAPSAPALKGTDVILDTFERLKNEGLKFETKFIQGMKNNELIGLLTDCDILVDELVLNGPGILSFEAMVSGCAVATNYYEKSPASFRPPVYKVTRENVYEAVKKLVQDKEYRKRLAFEGRKYAELNNEVSIVVKNILNKLSESQRPSVYHPEFFRDHFVLPENETISSTDKEMNDAVGRKWITHYDQFKPSLAKRNLV